MSWIVSDKETGEAVMETFSPEIAAGINRDRFNVEDAETYLVRLNARYRDEMTEAVPPRDGKPAQLSLF